MKSYNFRLILRGFSEITEAVEDSLFEAGCDDGHLGMVNGVGLLEFDRAADSFCEALCSAIRDVEQVGYRVVRVEPEDFVTASEVARRSDRTRASVSWLISGQRGPGTFPPPVANLDTKSPLWRWSEVARWLSEYEGADLDAAEQAEDLAFVNDLLSLRPTLGEKARLRDALEVPSGTEERLGASGDQRDVEERNANHAGAEDAEAGRLIPVRSLLALQGALGVRVHLVK